MPVHIWSFRPLNAELGIAKGTEVAYHKHENNVKCVHFVLKTGV